MSQTETDQKGWKQGLDGWGENEGRETVCEGCMKGLLYFDI